MRLIASMPTHNKLAIRAEDGSSDTSGGGGFFNQNIEARSSRAIAMMVLIRVFVSFSPDEG